MRVGRKGEGGATGRRRGGSKTAKAAKARRASGGVVEHFRPADLSSVEVESDALNGAVFYFFNCGRSGHSKAELEGLVKRLGGTVRPKALR